MKGLRKGDLLFYIKKEAKVRGQAKSDDLGLQDVFIFCFFASVLSPC